MKLLILISLLSCLVVGTIKSAQTDSNTSFQSYLPYLQGFGATCLGGAIGWGLGECFGAPKRGAQLGLIVPALVAGGMAYKKNVEIDFFVDSVVNRSIAVVDSSAGERLTGGAALRDRAFGACTATVLGLIGSCFFSK